jgi:hypothetical protein
MPGGTSAAAAAPATEGPAKECQNRSSKEMEIIVRDAPPPQFTLVLYHKNCVDGYASFYLANKRFPGIRGRPIHHHSQVTEEELRGQRVLMVDVCLSAENMERCLRYSVSFELLDHHATTRRLLSQLPALAARTTLDLDASGVLLTWRRLFPDAPVVPALIEYIHQRDTFSFLGEGREKEANDEKQRGRLFSLAFYQLVPRTLDAYARFDTTDARGFPLPENDATRKEMDRMVDKGVVLREAQQLLLAEYVASAGFPSVFYCSTFSGPQALSAASNNSNSSNNSNNGNNNDISFSRHSNNFNTYYFDPPPPPAPSTTTASSTTLPSSFQNSIQNPTAAKPVSSSSSSSNSASSIASPFAPAAPPPIFIASMMPPPPLYSPAPFFYPAAPSSSNFSFHNSNSNNTNNAPSNLQGGAKEGAKEGGSTYKVHVVNVSPALINDVGEALAPTCDFVMLWYAASGGKGRKRVHVALRSSTRTRFNVEEIAARFGGGGHCCSAHFVMDLHPFLRQFSLL